MSPQTKLLCIIIVLTVISGLLDAQGFINASKAWEAGKLVWSELAKAALCFSVGISFYLVAVKFLKEFGVISPEIQALFWFGMTIAGVAILNGKFFHWPRADQAAALVVCLGLGWLLFRRNG